MDILLIAATELEFRPAMDKLSLNPDLPLRYLITGVGGVPAAVTLLRSIYSRRPQLIIQAGVAGSFDEMSIDTVIVGSDAFGDLGVMEAQGFRTTFDLGLSKPGDFPFTNGTLVNPYRKLLDALGLPVVNAITVNEITTSPERIAGYKQSHQPVVESMEGAAFHYVCLQENIPFLQLRSISNLVGVRDKEKWKLQKAIAALNQEIESVIKNIVEYDEAYFRI